MSGQLTSIANHDDDELEALYQSVLSGYPIAPPPQATSPSSSSGRPARRPLPPTPGGSAGRSPVPPTTSSSTPSRPSQPPSGHSSIAESPLRNPVQNAYFPEAEPEYHHSHPSESLYQQASSSNDTHLSPHDSNSSIASSSTPAWVPPDRPVSTTEYDEVELPGYVRAVQDDPNAFWVSTPDDPQHTLDYAYQTSSLDNGPIITYHQDRPYLPEDSSDALTPGRAPYTALPHETEDQPPYEYDPPDRSFIEGVSSYEQARLNDYMDPSPSEASTFMSGDFPMLQRPRSHSSLARFPYASNTSPLQERSYDSNPASNHSNWDSFANTTASLTSRDPELDRLDWNQAGPSNPGHRVTGDLLAIQNFHAQAYTEYEDEEDDDNFEDQAQFLDLSLLSNIAVQLQQKLPRGTHVKGSVPYQRAFTGKDLVTTIHAILEQKLIRYHSWPKADRRVALQVARSLQRQLFFYEVEWGSRTLQDGLEDVYMFLDDPEESSMPERAELPSGVVTMLTKCYSIMCSEGTEPCYSYCCPLRGMNKFLTNTVEPSGSQSRGDWTSIVPAQVLENLSQKEINRQIIIHKLINKEEQFVQDLDIVEEAFIRPLRTANVVNYVDEFIDEVFGNLVDLRDCNRRLLEIMYVRQREEAPIIKTIGDIFLHVATEFRRHYPIYVGRQYLADKRLKEELENNAEFRLFIEKCERDLSAGRMDRLDLRKYLNRPGEHLRKYPVLLEAVYHETPKDNPDGEFLLESITAIKNLQSVAQLRTFQSAMGKGQMGKWEWHELVGSSMRKKFTKEEIQRQSLIFELIKGEMEYVRDLENMEIMYIRPLRNAEPPIIPIERLDQFLQDVFHNFQELHSHHRRLVDKLHEIQLEEHPRIKSIAAAMLDATLNFREAYMEYIPNYPIAAYRIDDEMANNPAFKAFVEEAIRHPDAYKLDMKAFINRPIPRLLRYELLLKEILSQTPIHHDDRDAIPEVIELISSLARETGPGVESAKQKVELWRYNSNLVFKAGDIVDMDLLNEHRSLLYTGKLLGRPDNGIQEFNAGWTELFALLFDNYFVLTKPRERDGVTKYIVYKRPIPLDLLVLTNFTDPPVQRNVGILWPNARQSEIDRALYPMIIQHNGRNATVPITLYTETERARAEWKMRLEEALGLRAVVSESNRVFEIETLSIETFLIPPLNLAAVTPGWHDVNTFTGKVTCSVPFNTPDGRPLVAIGCAEGVWIGFRHDSRSMRRVLHVRMVSQCAMLEDFGLFLVLADKNLFAYHIEALVPNPHNPQPFTSQTPQKINGSKEVQFFSVGTLHGRTLVIYMNKKGADSVFHVVEPVIDKITERPKATSSGILPLLSRRNKSDWFRNYRDFSITGDAIDLIFLKAKIAVLWTKGFEIMDLLDLNAKKSVTIPQREQATVSAIVRRCDSCRPLGMFRCTEDEFLLCYNEFGLYVNKQGYPSRNIGVIEWEGNAERVAFHAPYILLFDTRFIEIRHIDTCRLAQILMGTEIRCVWDGRGADTSPASIPDKSDENMTQEPKVHAVMNVSEQVTGPRRGITQHVFELVPTIPLYLPGSLTSPSAAPYYPQSFSPPRSPVVRSSSFRP